MQRHSSALALASLTIAGLVMGAILAFDVNPAIEATHEAIVATRRLEQHDTALGVALLRVRQGQPSDESALVEAARTIETESEPLLDRQRPTTETDAGGVALAEARQAAGTQIRRQLQVIDDFKSAIARGDVRLRCCWRWRASSPRVAPSPRVPSPRRARRWWRSRPPRARRCAASCGRS